MTRHRPTYLLWVAGGYLATCDCHYGQRVTLDRPLPACRPTLGRAA